MTDPVPCLHGATPGRCAFAGCNYFVPHGPRDERWAFRPGTTAEDIDAALAESAAQHARAPGSASPIHLVVDRKTRERLGDPPRFHALEWARIRGRGFVAVVECDVERDRNESGLVGLVVIDEEPFECVGVERHVPAFPIQPGEKIGLLVREVAP